MNLFRKNSPSARETFLVAALAAIGVDEAAIAVAQTAGVEDFLANALEASEKITGQLATAQANLATAHDALTAAGLPLPAAGSDVAAYATALKGAITARETAAAEAASRKAAEELAARGIPAVPTSAAAATGAEAKPGDGLKGIAQTRAIFEARLSQAARN